MKKTILTLCITVMLSATAAAKDTATTTTAAQKDFVSLVHKMQENALNARYDGNYKDAERIASQTIMIFATQTEKIQTDNIALKSELYYDIARYRSLQNDRKGAVEAFELAIKNGWHNYEFSACDSDLSNMRKDSKFNALLESIK